MVRKTHKQVTYGNQDLFIDMFPFIGSHIPVFSIDGSWLFASWLLKGVPVNNKSALRIMEIFVLINTVISNSNCKPNNSDSWYFKDLDKCLLVDKYF